MIYHINMENRNYYEYKLNNLLMIKKIVTIHYQELIKKYSFNGEKHNFWEIAYVDKNQITYHIENKKIILNAGEILFISPNLFHSLKCEKDANLFIISFVCNSPCMNYFKSKKIQLDNSSINLLSNIIKEAKSTFNLPKFNPNLNQLQLLEHPLVGGEQMIKNYLEIFLIKLLRKDAMSYRPTIVFLPKTNENLSFEEKVINFLNNSLYRKVTIEDVCKETRYCKTYVCTHFKKAMNVSIIDYYLNLKIEEAKKLIINGFSFSQIFESLCFDTPSHFTNTFKKYTNMTPSQYKKSISS